MVPAGAVTREAVRLVPTTLKPRSTNASAAALPIPEEAPVTSATGCVVIVAPRLSYDHNLTFDRP